MTSSFSKAAKLKHWLSRPDCPKFLQECKLVFDKAFRKQDDLELEKPIAVSAFVAVPSDLKSLLSDHKIALRARHRFDKTIFSCHRTHVGSSLIMFHRKGDRTTSLVPGSIEYIIARPTLPVLYAVRQQMPAPGTVDPYY